MTDEEQHRNTLHWPSEANILRAIANLVDGASAGDAFIFYYAGHSGQQPAEKDTREIDGLDEYILTWDGKIILDDTLRACLVDKLPKGTRLTAILDACHSGTLLDLDHYSCHWFLRRRCQSLTDKKKPVAPSKELARRRHTEAPWQVWPVHNAAPLPRVTFSGAATIVLAVVRLKFLKAKPKNPKDDPPSPPERPLCGGWYCAYTLLSGPLVISVSACSDHESTFEDRKRSGKGMTVKLIKILSMSVW
ncbi:caspase domain-containing protein [Lactifluus subvellereus]|nr:caspase domain-containing protein [Lactifluus subvellereus]